MATYHARGRFARDIYPTKDGPTPAPTAPDLGHDENDHLYWKVWAIYAKCDLAELVSAEQLADFLTEIQTLTPCRQWHKLMAQYHLQRAAQLMPVDPGEGYTQTVDGVWGNMPDSEIIF